MERWKFVFGVRRTQRRSRVTGKIIGMSNRVHKAYLDMETYPFQRSNNKIHTLCFTMLDFFYSEKDCVCESQYDQKRKLNRKYKICDLFLDTQYKYLIAHLQFNEKMRDQLAGGKFFHQMLLLLQCNFTKSGSNLSSCLTEKPSNTHTMHHLLVPRSA